MRLCLYILCFLSAFCCDITFQLFSRERGGALDQKNPDLYSFHENVRTKKCLNGNWKNGQVKVPTYKYFYTLRQIHKCILKRKKNS